MEPSTFSLSSYIAREKLNQNQRLVVRARESTVYSALPPAPTLKNHCTSSKAPTEAKLETFGSKSFGKNEYNITEHRSEWKEPHYQPIKPNRECMKQLTVHSSIIKPKTNYTSIPNPFDIQNNTPSNNNNNQTTETKSSMAMKKTTWKKFIRRGEIVIGLHREGYVEPCFKKSPQQELMKELGALLQNKSKQISKPKINYGVMPKVEVSITN